MNLKSAAPGLAMLAAIGISMAPNPGKTFEFIPEVCDFGTIREVNGKVTATVKAVNVSPDTTFITSVRTSCGCTGATYTDRILAPGDTAEISVTYDPENRPGRFLKTVKIFSGLERTSSTFKIKGNVIPGEQNLLKSYPYQIGDLRLSTTFLDLGEVSTGEVRPLFVGLYNTGDKPLILASDADCLALEPRIMPDTIQGNDPGTLSVILKANRLKSKGQPFQHHVFLIDTQTKDTVATIPVGGFFKKTE